MTSKYQYVLLSNSSGRRLQLENSPQGWDAQRFNIVRDLIYLGVLKTISVEFLFVGDGFDFLQRERLLYGMDADIVLRVYNRYRFQVEGKLNFENYDEDRDLNAFRVDIVQSSFVQNFNNREDIKLNVLNDISLDRKPVVPAVLKNALFRGRSIDFNSQFEGSASSEPDIYHHTVPFLIKTNGNPGVQQAYGLYADTWVWELDDDPLTDLNPLILKENAVYVNTLSEPQIINLDWAFKVTMKYTGGTVLDPNGTSDCFVSWKMLIVNEDNTISARPFWSDYISRKPIMPNLSQTLEFSYSDTHVLDPGQYIIFLCEQWTDFAISILQPANNEAMSSALSTEYTYTDIVMSINSPSVISDTTHAVILPHELFSNLIAQINGGTFYSDVFGREDLGYDEDGDWAYLGITTGELLRGIPLETTDVDGTVRKIQVVCSLRDAFKSYSSIICLGAIITEGQVRIDPVKELFNKQVAVDLGEVNKLHISPSKEFLFNSLAAGYPKNEYEQENGRDEPNTTYQYTNSFKSVKKELNIVSVFNGDGYGIEFARRNNVKFTGTADTKYDGQIFLIDLIKDGTELKTRRLEGILLAEGIFSPETAYNLRITVGQNLYRWQEYLNIPLHRKDKVYYFQSKDKNVSLHVITELGETIDGEDIVLSDKYLFLPEERGFKCPLSLANFFNIVANPLGLVKYTYKKETFFDHIFEVIAETDKATSTWRVLGTKSTPVLREEVEHGPYLQYDDGLEDLVLYDDGETDFIQYDGDEV